MQKHRFIIFILLLSLCLAAGAQTPKEENKITRKFDWSGSSYFYVQTDGAFDEMIASIRKSFIGPDTNPQIINAFNMAEKGIASLGLGQVAAMESSVSMDGNYYLAKSFIHIPSGRKGIMQAYGGEPHASKSLAYTSADTAIFASADMDAFAFLKALEQALLDSGFYQGTSVWGLGQSIVDSKIMQISGQPVKMRDLLQAMGNEYGFIFNLHSTENLEAAIANFEESNPQALIKPLCESFSLVIVIETKNDLPFRAMVSSSVNTGISQGEVTVDGIRKFRFQNPNLETTGLTPAVAYDGDCMLIATHIPALNNALKQKTAGSGNLVESPEFKMMTRDFPMENNGMVFLSKNVVARMVDLYTTFMEKAVESGELEQEQYEQFRKFFKDNLGENMNYASVRVNQPDGIMSIERNSQAMSALSSNNSLMTMPAAGGIGTAVAVPGFLKARQKAQLNACLEAQEKMEGAVDNWALDEGKTTGDQPTAEELIGYTKYLKEHPTCPEGGKLAIPKVGEKAKCPLGIHHHDDAKNNITPKFTCIEAQMMMEGAVDNWALDEGKTTGDQPTAEELFGYENYLKEHPVCPTTGQKLAIPKVGEAAKCPTGIHNR